MTTFKAASYENLVKMTFPFHGLLYNLEPMIHRTDVSVFSPVSPKT